MKRKINLSKRKVTEKEFEIINDLLELRENENYDCWITFHNLQLKSFTMCLASFKWNPQCKLRFFYYKNSPQLYLYLAESHGNTPVLKKNDALTLMNFCLNLDGDMIEWEDRREDNPQEENGTEVSIECEDGEEDNYQEDDVTIIFHVGNITEIKIHFVKKKDIENKSTTKERKEQ